MNNIKKNYILNVCYQMLIIIIPLITTPYISRALGAEGIGVYSYGYSIANYFVLFIILGINNYGNRTVAIARDDRSLLSETFFNIYITQFLLGILLTGIYFVYCFKSADDFYAATILGLYVISGTIDINWFFNGLEEFKLTVVRNTLIKVLCTLAIFIFVNNQGDTYKYCLILSIGNLISQAVLWPFLNKRIFYVKPSYEKAKVHLKPNIMLFSTVLAVSLFKIMDKIMLGLMVNKAEVGFYESAEKIINIPIAFVTALGTVMLPRITNMVASGKDNNKELLQTSLFFAMFLSTSICFGIMSVADIFVPIFYGEGFDECIALFEILLPSCLFLAFANVVRTQYLLPHRMDKVYITSAFLGAGVNIIINLLLIPYIQARGAAIGTLISEVIVCLYQSYHVHKYVPIKRYAIQSIPMVASGILMFFGVRSISLEYSNLVNLVTKIIIGTLIYLILFIIFSIPYRKTYINLIKKINSM